MIGQSISTETKLTNVVCQKYNLWSQHGHAQFVQIVAQRSL